MPKPTTPGARIAYALDLFSGDNPPSFREIDRLTGLSLGHTQQIVAGDVRDPGGATLTRIASTIGCTAGWIVAGEGRAPTARGVTAAIAEARAKRAKEAER